MNIDSKKVSLIRQILFTEDEALLEQIRQLLSLPQVEPINWNSLSQAEKQAIEEGLSDIENGKISSHEDVISRVKEQFGL